MLVFDFHTHIFPESVADRAVKKLSEASGIEPFYDGTREGLLRSMAEGGIDRALNCPIATSPEQVFSIIKWASKINHRPIYSLASIHPDSSRPDLILSQIKEAGLSGIKLHPEYQHFSLDDSRLEPIWEICCDAGLLIVLHAGADFACSPPYRTDPKAISSLIERYPDLKLVAAHLGSWQMWENVSTFLAGTPVYIDTSFTLGLLSDEKIMEIIQKHGERKVLFGTDAPWRSQKNDIELFHGLPLSDIEKRRIMWDNALELLELEDGGEEKSE